jgi:hypothetical protein
MSLKTKLKGAVDKAFAAAGDLVVTGKLTNVTATSYNFSSGTTSSTARSESVQIIILDTKKSAGSAYSATAIMKSGPSLDNYDSIIVGTDKYSIIDISDNGFAVDLTLKKEV